MSDHSEPVPAQSPFTEAAAIIAFAVFGAYGIVLSTSFGALDDYTFLHNAILHGYGTRNLLIAAGRPVNGLLLQAGFGVAGSIENLTYLRAVTLVGIWLLSLGLYYVARRNGVAVVTALAIGCGIVLSPSFIVYAVWAQHFTTPVAGLIGLYSGYLSTPASGHGRGRRAPKLLVASGLLVFAMLIYQPAALFFWVAVLIAWICRAQLPHRQRLEFVVEVSFVFGSGMLGGLIALKIGQHFFPMADSARYGLTGDIPVKLSWFVTEAARNALSLLIVPASNAVSLAALALILTGFGCVLRRLGWAAGSLTAIGAVLCVLASYAPNLATAENWASYRSGGALGAIAMALFLLMAAEIGRSAVGLRPAGRRLPRVMSWLPTLLLIAVVLHVQRLVMTGFILPNVTELNNLAAVLQNAQREHPSPEAILVLPSSWTDSWAKPLAYDEFGIQSSVAADYAHSMVDIVAHRLQLFPGVAIRTVESDALGRAGSQNVVLVDFRVLVASQRYRAPDRAWLE